MGLGDIEDFGGGSEDFKYAKGALPDKVLVEEYYKDYIDVASRANYEKYHEHYTQKERKIMAKLLEKMSCLYIIEGRTNKDIKERLCLVVAVSASTITSMKYKEEPNGTQEIL